MIWSFGHFEGSSKHVCSHLQVYPPTSILTLFFLNALSLYYQSEQPCQISESYAIQPIGMFSSKLQSFPVFSSFSFLLFLRLFTLYHWRLSFCMKTCSVQLSSVSQSRPIFATPRTTTRQASLSVTNFQNLLKLMSIESVMQSSHLILCHPFLLLPSIFPSIRIFSKESVLRIRQPKYWSFSISPFNEYSGLISFIIDGWISLQSKGLSKVFSNTTVQKHQFFSTQLSLWSNSHIYT